MAETQTPTRLYLVRHGEVEAAAQGTFLGFTDAGLSSHGRKQARILAQHLRAVVIDRIYASDLERALKTAAILGRGRSLLPVARPDFREMNMGEWDGKSWQEIERLYPKRKRFHFSNLNHFRFPRGEHWNPFRNRVLRGLKNILAESPRKNLLLVAHAGVNRVIVARALGLPFKHMFFLDQSYACLNIIDYFPGYALVRLVNGTHPV